VELRLMSTLHNELEPRFGRSVSLDQAAHLLKVSRRTIYNRIKNGRLKTIRTALGSQRVLLDSLHDLGWPSPSPASAASRSARSNPVLNTISLSGDRPW